jgi:hypothetical protein
MLYRNKECSRKYTLYKIIGDDYQKLKTAESPLEFDQIVKKDRSKKNAN